MSRIDAHQHFWKFDPIRDTWMEGALRKDYLPGELALILKENSFEGSVAVQASQTTEETDFLLNCAERFDFIKGVVGWLDLTSSSLGDDLERFAKSKLLKGLRHLIEIEPEGFAYKEQFLEGMALLKNFGLVYDILVAEHQLPIAIDLAEKFPDQYFVLDHMAKPKIRNRYLETWKQNIKRLAGFPNVFCKVSGMATEANLESWVFDDFVPYLDTAFEAFGEDRLLFGSDWPVCLLAGDYGANLSIVETYLKQFSNTVQTKVMGINAKIIYNL